MPIATLLLDLDGTIVTTEELKLEAHRRTVAQLSGRDFITRDRYCELTGMSSWLMFKAILAERPADCTYNQYREVYKGYYRQLVQEQAQAHPGVLEFLQLARTAGLNLVVVSSSSRTEMELVLDQTGIQPLIDGFVSADDVEQPKPDPEPYRKALTITHSNPDQALALEDTDTGVESALAAGLPVIAVRHELNGRHTFQGARHVLHIKEIADAPRFLSLLLSL